MIIKNQYVNEREVLYTSIATVKNGFSPKVYILRLYLRNCDEVLQFEFENFEKPKHIIDIMNFQNGSDFEMK